MLRRRLLHEVELLVFLLLLAPMLVLSLVVTRVADVPFPVLALATILRDLSLLALVLFFLWRNGEPVGRIGLTRRRLGREALLGLVLFVPVSAAAAGVERGLRALGLSEPTHVAAALIPRHGPQMVLAFFLVVVVAVVEETLFRGYLLYRLMESTRSAPVAVLFSAALFGIGHGYEGTAGIVAVGLLGAMFALVYLWRGSLVAPIVMHFCQDFVAILLVPSIFGHG